MRPIGRNHFLFVFVVIAAILFLYQVPDYRVEKLKTLYELESKLEIESAKLKELRKDYEEIQRLRVLAAETKKLVAEKETELIKTKKLVAMKEEAEVERLNQILASLDKMR